VEQAQTLGNLAMAEVRESVRTLQDGIPEMPSLSQAILTLVDTFQRTTGIEVHLQQSELTTFDNDQYIVDALKAGAKGYLLKDMDMDKLAQAIRMAHQGYPQMSPGVLEKFIGKMAIVEQLGGKKTDLITEEKLDLTTFNNLTRREREILEAMGQGLNNREIAATLFLSASTIRSHISNMVSSLNVEDRFELRFYAKRMFKNRHKPSTR
jgi:DNA-binding NarL/FixJ family response regulator